MNFWTLALISVGLSMDAFAVSVANGAIMGKIRLKSALKIALFFGGFQALMPMIGWLAGWGFRSLISSVDHWIAFGLLSIVGGKMIFESTELERENGEAAASPCSESLVMLFTLAVATSIDALAVGLSFSFLKVSIPFPALFIGFTTFAISFLGVCIGTKVGHFFEKRIGILGGLILLGIGLKILIEHLSV